MHLVSLHVLFLVPTWLWWIEWPCLWIQHAGSRVAQTIRVPTLGVE